MIERDTEGDAVGHTEVVTWALDTPRLPDALKRTGRTGGRGASQRRPASYNDEPPAVAAHIHRALTGPEWEALGREANQEAHHFNDCAPPE